MSPRKQPTRAAGRNVRRATKLGRVHQELAWYFGNCAFSPSASRLVKTLSELISQLADDDCRELIDSDDLLASLAAGVRTSAGPRASLESLRRAFGRPKEALPIEGSEERGAAFARDEFGLDATDTEILLLAIRYERNENLESLADAVLRRLRDAPAAVAALIGATPRIVRPRLSRDGALVKTGLIDLKSNEYSLAGSSGVLQLARPLRRALRERPESQQAWLDAVVGEPSTPTLVWEDFQHLGAAQNLALKIIDGALTTSAKGVNILLHGPVGTGKTEFAKTLAERARARLWSIGEADEDGDEPSRSERLGAHKLLQRLLAKRGRSVLLFDEAEDLLDSGATFGNPFGLANWSGSKVHMNRMFEDNAAPVIWTCNDVERIAPAFLRRMVMAIEVKTPNAPVRARIWRRVLDENDVRLDDAAVQRLSARHAAPPAVAFNGARAAALAGGGEAEIEAAMSGVLKILGVRPETVKSEGPAFDPALVNCGQNLDRLADSLTRPGVSSRWSLCLHGAPGTGKSEFATYLADRLGMEVLRKRASDLLDMYVGGSEKQIASAFEEAASRKAMLIFDEADSLLSDRRGARQSWEVSQVNEMLTWMESHPYPFVCTTNLIDRLDQASLRRFAFKLRFDTLTPPQSALAFARFFGVPAPRDLPDGLAPGDFATVLRKWRLLDDAGPDALVDWLREEVEAKGVQPMPIGFRRPKA